MIEAPRHAIDLTRHHFVRHLGELSLYGSWLYNEDQESTEPALVVIPRYRTIGFAPCVVALSAAFRYDDPRYLARAAAHFSRKLGFEDSMVNAHKIASLIHDHLDDLLTMPLDPQRAIIVGEATLDLGDGSKKTVELVDREQVQQA